MRYEFNQDRIIAVYMIWDMLLSKLPERYHNYHLAITASEDPHYNTYQGAYCDSWTVVIGSEFINRFDSYEALAGILAHELGHVIMHPTLEGDITPAQEDDADSFALYLCELIGVDPTQLYVSWGCYEEWRAPTLSEQHIKEHGHYKDRLKRIETHVEYIKELD